jgi:hypothetical protein
LIPREFRFHCIDKRQAVFAEFACFWNFLYWLDILAHSERRDSPNNDSQSSNTKSAGPNAVLRAG